MTKVEAFQVKEELGIKLISDVKLLENDDEERGIWLKDETPI